MNCDHGNLQALFINSDKGGELTCCRCGMKWLPKEEHREIIGDTVKIAHEFSDAIKENNEKRERCTECKTMKKPGMLHVCGKCPCHCDACLRCGQDNVDTIEKQFKRELRDELREVLPGYAFNFINKFL